MASRKKPSEGIALLSMYNDEDDEDMEDIDDQQVEDQQLEEAKPSGELDEYRDSNEKEPNSLGDAMVTDEFPTEVIPPVLHQNSISKDGMLRPPTPQQPQVSFSSSQHMLQQQQQPTVRKGTKRRERGRLTIVDYAHDEVAMSPEPDEEELGEELQSPDGDSQERTSPGGVWILTPSTQATPQLSEHLEQPDDMNTTVNQSETAENNDDSNFPAENADPLDKFLPPPPKEMCPEELQKRIDKFLLFKKVGRSFNAEVRNRKDYRNPDFLLHAVRYQDIDQIGSCFSKDVFDPHGYDKSDFYEEIEADMRREKERKEQELKKSPKVEFVPGGTQPGQVVPPTKFSLPIPVAAASGLHSASSAADAAPRDGRHNKKSKWDKVDGDGRNPLPNGGQDSLATAAAHAAILSANVGAGYTAFVQQKRREAEEKRSSEKKQERRS